MKEEMRHGPLRAEEIIPHLPAGTAWGEILCLEETGSTNTLLKGMALEGAPSGTVVIAHRQTAGKGRLGRSFHSPEGLGLYLSVLLRPRCAPEAVMCATGMTAAAVCRAVEKTCAARPGIKWVNDLVLGGKKLCGILAETVMTEEGLALILGVGVNVHHGEADFPPEVACLATSLAREGFPASRSALAGALIGEMLELEKALGGDVSRWVEFYRARCVNIGRDVRLLWSDQCRRARALDVDGRFGLVVRYENGEQETLRTGEVSVRGLYGYTE